MITDEILEEFVSATGTNRDIARMFLERHQGDIQLALSAFLDGENRSESPTLKPLPVPARQAQAVGAGGSSSSSNIATFSSFKEEKQPDEDQQAFYAGGSSTSGQQILGPKKDEKVDADKFVKKMFEDAMKSQQESGNHDPSEKPKNTSFAFRGTGHTLGETDNDSRVVKQGSVPRGMPEESERVLKLWEDGFSIDDGPLRNYSAPENKEFLDEIRRGQVPKELAKEAVKRGLMLSLAMEDHRTEKFVAPKKVLKPFGGQGQRLGNLTDESPAAPASQSQASSNVDPNEAAKKAQSSLNFQAGEPNTRIQIRLPDGSRLVPEINLSRAVSDLRQYVNIARPDLTGRSFNFMTTFPNKVIQDETSTIQAAGLANAAIVMRFI